MYPYSPEQKGTVEGGIKYLQGNFIAGRTFANSADMKGQLTGRDRFISVFGK
jgi:hypothetical protein